MVESLNDIFGHDLQEGNSTPLLRVSFLAGQREKALFSLRQHTAAVPEQDRDLTRPPACVVSVSRAEGQKGGCHQS